MRSRRLLVPTLTLTLALALAGCGADTTGQAPDPGSTGEQEPAGDTLVIYSGRNENLVGPVLERLEEAVGLPVEVRYASSGELAAQLLEEGDASSADLFFSQDAGALGALASAGMLAPLDTTVTDLVPADYQDAQGRWVATSGRARVLAYDPEQAPQVAGFTGIDEILDPALAGSIAYAPTNASFHAFVTALRIDRGEDGAREWLEKLADLRPATYENNNAVLDAVDGGQAAVGLINHYYWYQKVAELGADAVSARIHFLDSDDPGALVNVAGAGVLSTSDNVEAATAAIAFLLSDEIQQYFADETAEYPVVDGVTSEVFELEPLSELDAHQIDLNELESLETTLALLDSVGLT
ncbi:extracellular solute-binding protein [Actinotalea sp. K2]|uniref:extracellular solute-binding protein n=1 Tax=Actinotalea sp. K2 TaxID=2939438 RepID=UPI0020176EEE|nr:extracellular solute-binding protein [Actinotalea sp. K2]MCL3862446.1 extracellular solute-binding protein [Actinotalea sp. K2]